MKLELNTTEKNNKMKTLISNINAFESINNASLAGDTKADFRVDESGQASVSIPLFAPAGTAGVAPQLSLNYNSSTRASALISLFARTNDFCLVVATILRGLKISELSNLDFRLIR